MDCYFCEVSELEERKPFVRNINGIDVGVILVKNELHAFQNTCPHMGGPVCLGDVHGRVKSKVNENLEIRGEFESDDEVHIICPWHGLEFNIDTGQCIPEPDYSLRGFQAVIKNNQVFVSV